MAEGIASSNVKIKTKSEHTDGVKTSKSISKSAFKSVSSKFQSELSSSGDLGSQAAGMAMKAGGVGAEAFKAAQKLPDVTVNSIKGVCKVGKGIYQVGLTGTLGVVTAAQTVSKLKGAQISPISPEAARTLRVQAAKTGLNKTALSRRLMYSVNGVCNRVKSTIHTAKSIGYGIKTGYNVVRGAISGKTSIKISKEAVRKFALKAVSKSMVAVDGNVYKLAKGSVKAVSSPVISSGINGIAGTLQSSDNFALQGVGAGIRGTDLGIRTSIKGLKATGYTVKTAVKTGRGAVHAGMFIKNNGLRAAWNATRGYGARTAQNALKAMLNAIKAFGKKVIIPILIIAIVVMACSGVITVPVTAVASIFGSFFSTKDTKKDFDIKDFLNTFIPERITEFQNDLAAKLEKSRSEYNIVRLKSNFSSDEVVSPNLNGIISVFPSNDEVINMIQPVFNAVILMEYDLEPTEKQAKDLAEKIFSKLFSVTTEKTTEQCGQDLLTGRGTVLASHTCGSIHAKDNCPNKITGKHASYTCSDCCVLSCPGHTTKDGVTTYCPGCVNTCSGYSYCGGHSVITYTLSVEGVYVLEYIYFKEPMEELLNKETRTEEEENKLAQLKDYHEIFSEMMNDTTVVYNSGFTMADLSGVKFKDSKRIKNKEVVDKALSQKDQKGGQPFWSYLGFSKRVEWCACFVNWCMRNTPSATKYYPNLPSTNNASCINVANYFKKNKQFADRNYTDLVAGDVIFFDYDNVGETHHIGIVIGVDGKYVYTVEGNTPGDKVSTSSYPLKSKYIYGYGLMNYPHREDKERKEK